MLYPSLEEYLIVAQGPLVAYLAPPLLLLPNTPVPSAYALLQRQTHTTANILEVISACC